MDTKGNNRRAYAPGDDTTLTVQEDGKSGGKCSLCTPKRLVCATVTAVAIIIIIVITAVLSSQNNENDKVVASSVTQEMVSVSRIIKKPTTQPPPTTRMTFGPAVIGYFEGTFVMGETYGDFFDDLRAQMTIAFKRNFTEAMDEVYNVPSAALYMYQETIVDQLVENGTNVQVMFTVSLNAINRGGRDHLVTVLGSFPSNAMNTYPVLWADIKREKNPLPA